VLSPGSPTVSGWRQAGAVLLAAGALACRARSHRAIHLPVSSREWLEAAAETRPGTWLTSGDAIVWDMPAGPRRRIDGGYLTSMAGDPPGRLEIRRLGREGSNEPAGAVFAVPLSGGGTAWRRWTAELPASKSPGRLEIVYRAAEPESPRSLFLTEPTISAGRREAPKTVLLFLVDTLRADRVSGYGYARPTTPRLDRYFQDGLRAQVALPSADWTLPSHASLLTSTSVARHGVGRPGRIVLPDDLATLAEAFQQAGFRTLAVTGGGYVDPTFGFRRGFDRFAVEYGPAARAVDDALAMLREHAGEPVFLFLHTYQLHGYAPDEASARALFPDLSVLGPNWRGDIGELRSRQPADPSVIPFFRARYDAALRSVDAAFGRLLDGLAESGRLDRTAAIFTSDHGESLCERTVDGRCLRWGHGTPYAYEEELDVPLEARVPWRPGVRGVLRGNASLLDVAPTLLDAAGVPIPTAFEGHSLLAAAPPADRILVTEAPPLDAIAVREGSRKLIRRTGMPQTFTRPPRFHQEAVWLTKGPFIALPAEECFDLARDPGEAHPVPCDAAWGGRLRDAADRYLASGFPGSLVLRIPAASSDAPARETVVRARGLGRAPALRTFGLAPAPAAAISGDAIETRFHAGPAPVWIALEPANGSGAIEITLAGLGRLASASGSALAPGSFRWRELAWETGRGLPAGVAVFTTAPAARPAAADGALPNDVVARLRALGYLAGPNAPAAAPAPAAPEPAGEAREPLTPGEVRIRRAD